MHIRKVNISLQTGRFQMRFKTKEVNDDQKKIRMEEGTQKFINPGWMNNNQKCFV